MSNVRIENGLVVGTSGDKYATKNPIGRYLLSQFDKSIADMAAFVDPSTVLEIGCGEGHITKILVENTRATIHATEISPQVLQEAKERLVSERVRWEIAKLESYKPLSAPEMVVCCEVLEHVDDPVVGLTSLAAMRANWYILSVPREPIWRALNMLRGVYVKDFGNSPGHIHHWSRSDFIKLVSRYLDVVEVKSPLPWTVLLCRSH